MKTLVTTIALLLTLTCWAADKAAPKPTLEQQEAKIRAAHVLVIQQECTTEKRASVEVCRQEANETLAEALRDLRKQHKQKDKQ